MGSFLGRGFGFLLSRGAGSIDGCLATKECMRFFRANASSDLLGKKEGGSEGEREGVREREREGGRERKKGGSKRERERVEKRRKEKKTPVFCAAV